MIVKNESKIIRETLQKLCAKINFDFWVISDTGSTDNTIKVWSTDDGKNIRTFDDHQDIV
jgi:WD40 repeat protein